MRPSYLFRLASTAVILLTAPCRAFTQGDADRAVAAAAETLARQGQTVQAEQAVLDYLKLHPRSVPVNVVAGELEQFRHNWQKAMEYFEVALREEPADQPARNGERAAATALALHQRATQDGEGALATLRAASTALPNDLTLLTDLALQAQSMHRFDAAHGAITRALQVDPQSDRALYAAAGIEYDRGHSAEAVEDYGKFLALHPDDATAHFGLGRALRVQQRPADAKLELQRSLQIQPMQTESYYQLGEIARESGAVDEAREDYQKALGRVPTHAGALTGLGMLAYSARMYLQALTALQQAVQAAPEYEPAHYYLGLTYQRLGHRKQAERELSRAATLSETQQGRGDPKLPE